ncbi:Cytochrome P450 family protein [Rhynchospora pubera]|uniref:Cytochrome P450 family protein n=1 Tax=Rhynchospora pubera TaxID=906938 RepID=A0AAV8E7X9_9POAL|nr:Cytochrome P450 family protein [Rhynchospora pubera]
MDCYQWFGPIFLSLSAFIYALLCFKSNKRKTSPPFEPNSDHGFPIIGHIPQFIINRHRFLDWTTELLAASPTNTITIHRPIQGVITANPANIEYILKINCQNYPKGSFITSTLWDFLGGCIFNADDEQWKAQRKAASFEFNTKSLRAFVVDHVKYEISARLIPLFKNYASTGEILDLQDVFERFSMDSVCRLVFGEDTACLEGDSDVLYYSSSFADAFKEAEDLSAGRFHYALPCLWKLKKLFDIGSEHRLRCSIERVHAYAMDIVRLKKKKIEDSLQHEFDLLSRFIASGQYSDAYLRDVIVNFILAGRETTSSAMTWFFWLLSQRPDVKQKILDEISLVKGDLGFQELREMNYLHAAITEAMRLYPPVPVNSMMCREDDTLPDGTFVGKQWLMSYNAYAMARMETIWGKDCTEYKPERWLADGVYQSESPFKFSVFHAGPRICLGKEMAYIQIKSVVACILGSFELEVVEKNRRPEMGLSLTLRMKHVLAVRVGLRQD